MFLREKVKNVFYSDEEIITLRDTGFLEVGSNTRLCAHKDERDELHEMIIFHKKGYKVRPHKHIDKSESFHIIKGEATIIVFDDEGNILRKVEMGAYGSGKVFYYRLNKELYHTLIIHKDLLFHEVTKGPFYPEDTIFPSWEEKVMEELR